MKIPLTLAIIPALIVTNRGERYAVPSNQSIWNWCVSKAKTRKKRIELIQGVPVLPFARPSCCPLVYLDRELTRRIQYRVARSDAAMP